MSNHNYSQYSNNKKKKNYNKPKVEETVVEETVTTVAAPTESVENKMVVEQSETAPKAEFFEPAVDVVVETVETVTLPKTVTGTVAGCTKLNVRAKPATDAEVVTILNINSEIEIDPARSTNEWVKITTADGVEGFCMRKFVNAKL